LSNIKTLVIFAKDSLVIKKFIKNFCKSLLTSSTELIYITGKTSSGKTDLLNVFGTELLLNNSTTKIKKIAICSVIDHFIQSIEQNQIAQFHNHYVQLDILLIDDFEYINNRPKTTEILIQFFNKIIKADKKVIISSLDKNGLKSIRKLLPTTNIHVINLDKNTVEIDYLIKVKSKFFGLRDTKYQPVSSDIREIEGLVKTEQFLRTLYPNKELRRQREQQKA